MRSRECPISYVSGRHRRYGNTSESLAIDNYWGATRVVPKTMTSRVSLIAQQSWSAILGDRVTGPPAQKMTGIDTNIDVANQSFCLLSTFADGTVL